MSGKHVWWYFASFFGFIAMVNAVMVTLAVRSHSGTVTEHPYEKGLAYNQVVEAEEKQRKLGWDGRITLQSNNDIYTFAFELRDKNKIVITPENVTVHFTRPTQAGLDFSVTLSDGKAVIVFPAKGAWLARVNAMHEGVHYQQSKRIMVQ